MLLRLLGFLAIAQSPDTGRARIPADAYANPATAEFVGRIREARERNERLVTSYTATVKQRIGVGIRALSRDRMLYRQELVARIAWQRDAPSAIEIVGAREGIPIALRGDRLPEELPQQARDLVMDPAQDYFRLVGGDDDEGFIYPLRVGGEADYRFALGDTTVITLPTGRRIRVVALKVTPRRSEWRLMAGTLWFDLDTDGLVQLVFRPARPFEFRRDIDPQDREDVPGWVNPVGEVKFVTLEYGLYETRWWMPRYMAIDASGSMGSWLNVPVRLERVYEDYVVEGGTPPDPESTFIPAGRIRRDRSDSIADPAERERVADSVRTAIRSCIAEVNARMEDAPGRVRRAERRQCWDDADSNLVVTVPDDTLSLLTHSELGPPILAMGDLISEAELMGLKDAIGELPSRQWAPHVALPAGPSALLQHARYNRIEGLSLGARGVLDLGPAKLTALGRIGLADQVVNGEALLARNTTNGSVALGVYRRLAAANPDTRPFGPINSALGFLAQRDDGEYYRALGAELVAENANSGWWKARVFVQRERPAFVETDASIPHLFNTDKLFRSNILADTADQYGATLTFRGTRALSHSLMLGGELTVEGAAGDFEYGRGAATFRLFVTPPGPLAGAFTAAAGTTTGSVPLQHHYFLGGAGTLRGYEGGVLDGTAYWLTRAEVGNSFPAVRVIAFGDVGWAGDREDFWTGRPLIGAGVGASFLDGLVRLDLARGLRSPTGWRFEFYFDGAL